MKILVPFVPHLARECLDNLGDNILPEWPEIDKKLIATLKNLDSLEKYGREKHFMKKQNEEIYIIEIED